MKKIARERKEREERIGMEGTTRSVVGNGHIRNDEVSYSSSSDATKDKFVSRKNRRELGKTRRKKRREEIGREREREREREKRKKRLKNQVNMLEKEKLRRNSFEIDGTKFLHERERKFFEFLSKDLETLL